MKKFLGFLLVALLGIALLSACTAEPEVIIETVEVPVEVEVEVPVEVEVEVPVEVEVATKTLVFTSRLFSPPREQEFFINEVIKPFEAEHGVSVNFQILDDDSQFDRDY
jgi:ABC-type glycerol-3-phosphate transport system substrate-binding protein